MKFKYAGNRNFSAVAFQYKAKHLSEIFHVAFTGPIFGNSSQKLSKKCVCFVFCLFLLFQSKRTKFKKSQNFKFFLLKSFSMFLGSIIPIGQVSYSIIDHFRADE